MTLLDPATIRRVVVRPPNWLGDAVLALPAMAAIRRHFPAATLTIAAAPAVAALFRERTGVDPDEVMDLPPANSAAVAALRGGGFDLGVLLPNSFRSAWQFRRAGIRERWGFGTSGRWWLLTRISRRAPRVKGRHQADYYRALVRGLDIECGEGLPALAASDGSRERARVLLAEHGVPPAQPLVVFAPGAAYGQAKQWPPDRVADVIARVAAELDAAVAIVGASHDREAARAIESVLRGQAPATRARVVDLVGRTSLGVLVGVAERSSVFVSNDSGAMHVAAALGRPVVAIFGPTDERATRPLGDHDVLTSQVFCRPCMLRDCPIDHRCMKRITVDQVYTVIERRLRAAAGGQVSA